MRCLIQAGVIAAALSVASAALAQALPDAVRSAGVTVTQWAAVQTEVRRAAAARGASERALAAVAERVSANLIQNGQIDLDQLLQSIDERAQQVADLQSQLSAMERADDPQVAALLSQARAAIDVGDLARGDQFLAEAAESDLASIARDQARLAARRMRAARTIGERGRLASLSGDYLAAATLYARAADIVPEADTHARWQFRVLQAAALSKRGDLFGELAPVREAIRLYRDVALPLVPRGSASRDWSATQNDLGNALQTLAERGDHQALRDAIAAFRSALEVDTRMEAPLDWATDQTNLGNVLMILGQLGDEQALRDAVLAYRSSLEVHTRASFPRQWALTQNNLAIALTTLGERGDEQALREAVAAARAALEVDTRDSDPAAWARDQTNLGNALMTLGSWGDERASNAAIAAYRASLEVQTRASSPALWAQSQNGLGAALTTLGQRGNIPAAREAIIAFRSALEVYTRDDTPRQWAQSQGNLGSALRLIGIRGDDQALREAIAAYQAALEVDTRANDPEAWARDQFNLALVLGASQSDRSQSQGALAAARNALLGFEQVGDEHGAQQARQIVEALEARSASRK